VLLGGAGTAGVEAAIASAVPSDGRLLVIDNGAYGARMAQIAAAYGIAHDVEQWPWGDEPRLERITARLDANDYSHLAVVHHETTTGMLNPVEAVADLCRRRGVQLIVDAMSSFAGIPIDIREMGADYLISSANKCIQGMAGLCFVICRRATLNALEVPVGRSLYLDLAAQQRFFEAQHQMRFTPPVQVLYALEQALTEFFAETQQGRWQRYRACFEALDHGMRELGFRRLLPERLLSRILTAYVEPDHPAYGYDELHDRLRERGFTIYPGKGAKEATFRLANMGAIETDDMRAFVQAMAETIDEMGIRPLYSDTGMTV
jgi:2-aminoethylphosphonate aminotransferase